jgi:hypothetical protein
MEAAAGSSEAVGAAGDAMRSNRFERPRERFTGGHLRPIPARSGGRLCRLLFPP